jgi:multicomponent K+:H+ antiporter subunit E
MIRRLLPFPILAIALLAFWLVLNQSLSPGHFLLGAGLAAAGGLILAAVEPNGVRCRRPAALAGLVLLVLQDIVRSNIAVARLILAGRPRTMTSDFVEIPLDLRAKAGLAALATIITATPGTVWVKHDPSTGLLTIHVLDLVDRDACVSTIKNRYEHRLMEIFE